MISYDAFFLLQSYRISGCSSVKMARPSPLGILLIFASTNVCVQGVGVVKDRKDWREATLGVDVLL